MTQQPFRTPAQALALALVAAAGALGLLIIMLVTGWVLAALVLGFGGPSTFGILTILALVGWAIAIVVGMATR